MFPVRYELDCYVLFRRNSVFKGLISGLTILTGVYGRDAEVQLKRTELNLTLKTYFCLMVSRFP
jgi:hypothetical protein